MKTIIVTGTPATGKTTLAKKLCKSLNYYYLDLNTFAKRYAKIGFDYERDSTIIDEDELIKILKKIITAVKEKKILKNYIDLVNIIKKKDGLVLDGHLSHYLPKKYVDLCFVTKCELKELEQRLIKRKYSPEKIRENLDSEIFDICYNEALEKKHIIFIVHS